MKTETRSNILRLLQEQPRTIGYVAEKLNLPSNTIRQQLKRMREKGEVLGKGKTLDRIYSIVTKDVTRDIMNTTQATLGKSQATSQAEAATDEHTIRLHAYAGLKRYTERLPMPEVLLRLRDMGYAPHPVAPHAGMVFYFTHINGLNARFTSSTATIWSMQKEGERTQQDATMVHAEAEAEVARAFALVERAFALKPELEVIERHVALTHDEFAEYVHEEGTKISVKDREDGLTRFLIDFSNKIPELEFVHAKKSKPDSKRYVKLVEGTIYGDFDYTKDHELLHGAILAIDKLEKRDEAQHAFAAKHNMLVDVLIRKEARSLPKKEREEYDRQLNRLNHPAQRRLFRDDA